VKLLHKLVAAFADAFQDQLGWQIIVLQMEYIPRIASSAAEIFHSQVSLAVQMVGGILGPQQHQTGSANHRLGHIQSIHSQGSGVRYHATRALV